MLEFDLKDESVYYTECFRPRFYVYWSLGNTCTYHCSYCPSRFHDGSVDYQPLEVVERAINKLSNLPMETHIKFTGGEATYHPDFEKIISESPDNIKFSVLSNGSRPLPFWERTVDKLFTITLTYHAEFANLDRFMTIAKLIYTDKKKPGLINLTMNPEKWDECVNVYNVMKENNLPVNIKPLLENFGSKTQRMLTSYTQDHITWIKEKTNTSTYKPIGIYNKDGVKINSTSPSELLALNKTNFSGWTCYNPTKCLDIDWHGNVYDSSCAQRRKAGSIYTDFVIATEPVLCVSQYCWCHSDIETKKVKNPS
jgi:MoaA/NifB/PqqE/SkfB family radical SAM enzyme